MNRKSIMQEYFILATNEKGSMSAINSDESKSGIVAAAVMDLLLNSIVALDKKKISVIADIPDQLGHIVSLYHYLKEKPRTIDKLMNDYILSGSSKFKQLTTELGQALITEHMAVSAKGGLFGNKTVYIPEKSYKDELIGTIRLIVMQNEEITPHDFALIYILKETKNLNQYFSKHESTALNTKLKEMKKNPQSKLLADMIAYVSEFMTIMIACFTIISN